MESTENVLFQRQWRIGSMEQCHFCRYSDDLFFRVVDKNFCRRNITVGSATFAANFCEITQTNDNLLASKHSLQSQTNSSNTQNSNSNSNSTHQQSLFSWNKFDATYRSKFAHLSPLGFENAQSVQSFITQDNTEMIIFKPGDKCEYNVYNLNNHRWYVTNKKLGKNTITDCSKILFLNDCIFVVSTETVIKLLYFENCDIKQLKLIENYQIKNVNNINSNNTNINNHNKPFTYQWHGIFLVKFDEIKYQVACNEYNFKFIIFGGYKYKQPMCNTIIEFDVLLKLYYKDLNGKTKKPLLKINEKKIHVYDEKTGIINDEFKFINFNPTTQRCFRFTSQCVFKGNKNPVFLIMGGSNNDRGMIIYNYNKKKIKRIENV